ncbi:MAG: hypothetical protein L3J10_10005 [Sulfurimonas sp.]|nr:hypothetical protein [Sulfurimonas sp.]
MEEKLDLVLEKIEKINDELELLKSNMRIVESGIDMLYSTSSKSDEKLYRGLMSLVDFSVKNRETMIKSANNHTDFLELFAKNVLEDFQSVRESIWSIDSTMMKAN